MIFLTGIEFSYCEASIVPVGIGLVLDDVLEALDCLFALACHLKAAGFVEN